MDGWMVHPVNHTSIHPFRAFKYPFIHCSMPESMGSAPVGVPCPLTSSLGEFPGYWDWLWYPGLSPVLVSIAFPFAFHISVSHSLFFLCHWISFVCFQSDGICARQCRHRLSF